MAKMLGFGCMRLPLLNKDDQTSVDLESLNSLVDAFIDRGFSYFDTALTYHGFRSEEFVGKAWSSAMRETSTYKQAQQFGTFEFVQGKKREGKIPNVGISFHDTPGLLEEILASNPALISRNFKPTTSTGITPAFSRGVASRSRESTRCRSSPWSPARAATSQ
jgi:Predicted oxidoreductases of the aldo/keto reductase family